MIVIDCFDEWLHFRALCLTDFGHAAGYLAGVSLDAGYKGVGKRM